MDTFEEQERLYKETAIKVEQLFYEISEVIKEHFVATYKLKDNLLIMNTLNGQTFCLSIEELR